jgi:hypothetical protein
MPQRLETIDALTWTLDRLGLLESATEDVDLKKLILAGYEKLANGQLLISQKCRRHLDA